jgi:2-dehydro-3-deoxygluconokinase
VLCFGEGLVTINRPADQPPPAWARCWMGVAGAEMNVAIGLARLGHAVRWSSALGDDPLGDAVLAAVRGEGVATEVVRSPQRTGMLVKVARPDAEPSVHYYRDGSAFAIAPPRPDPAGAGVVFLSGVTPALSPACRAAARSLVEAARAAGSRVCFDINLRRRLWSEAEAAPELRWFCSHADLVFAAADEAALVVGDGATAELAQRLRSLGAGLTVVKAGGEALAADAAGVVRVPRLPGVTVRDPIGAGDAFDAGFLSAQLEGLDLAAALQRGHLCAAAVCRTFGDWEGFPMRRDLDCCTSTADR